MKIIGTETRRNTNTQFSLFIVDNLENIFIVNVKNGFWKNADAYKKHVFTNGTTEKLFSKNEDSYSKVEFKVHDADWLIVFENDNNILMYISEQYCGPIKVKNKKIQTVIDESYAHCRTRITSKHEFAKEIGIVSRRLNLPFQLVLAFKGNEELLNKMVQNVENAIDNRLYENEIFMQALVSRNSVQRHKAIETFGIINIPSYQTEKIANYIVECLESKKVVRRYE